MLYEGPNDHFHFPNAKPFSNYQFELIAKSNEDKEATVMDTKVLSILTLPEGEFKVSKF
jgi:hypothetical protein